MSRESKLTSLFQVVLERILMPFDGVISFQPFPWAVLPFHQPTTINKKRNQQTNNIEIPKKNLKSLKTGKLRKVGKVSQTSLMISGRRFKVSCLFFFKRFLACALSPWSFLFCLFLSVRVRWPSCGAAFLSVLGASSSLLEESLACASISSSVYNNKWRASESSKKRTGRLSSCSLSW